ncbi:MAG TPA: pantetheine-phosphate adenylyltransferase [Actinomycetota bacterium]|nr:pantetheine-phosphate adenylyltransferase [Actinomycetota bacterium]
MTKACCPGSFDPVTNGHLDIISRARRQFAEVVVAVLENPSKQALFTVDERVEILNEVLGGADDVKVMSFSGLTVDFCKQIGATVIVRGLRTVSDYDFEEQMAQMNARMGVETAFMATNPAYSFLSASLMKEVVRYGGSVDGLVPEAVARRLEAKLGGPKGDT